jgi:uncharacterized membrane protein
VYAFLVLNRVAPPSEPSYVPDLAVWIVVPLLVLDVAGLFMLVRVMSHSLRLVEIIDRVHLRAETVIDTMYRDELEGGGDPEVTELPAVPAVTVHNHDRAGVVANLDVVRLVNEAQRLDTTIKLACAIGSYVATGSPVLLIADARTGLDEDRLRRAVTLSDERTIDQDPLYALRLLVDIATRALSPAVNDPTTAVQALDRIEDILSVLANRRLDRGAIRDDKGRVRLVVPLPSWEDFVSVGLTEIRQYGGTSLQVVRRLRAVLEDLLDRAPPARRPALEAELLRLDETVEHSFPNPVDRELALVSDRHGLGAPGTTRSRAPRGKSILRHETVDGGPRPER